MGMGMERVEHRDEMSTRHHHTRCYAMSMSTRHHLKQMQNKHIVTYRDTAVSTSVKGQGEASSTIPKPNLP